MFNSKRKFSSNSPKSIQPAASGFQSDHSQKPPQLFQQMSSASATTDLQNNEDEIDHSTENDEQTQHVSTITPDKMMAATEYGHEIFKAQSVFTNVEINGPFATGMQGCLAAPNIEGFMLSKLYNQVENESDLEMARAVSKVVSKHLKYWKEQFMLPQVHWYPAYAFVPSPIAPPMPNIPTPLNQYPTIGEYFLTNEDIILLEVMRELPSEMDNDANRAIVSSFSSTVTEYFDYWLNTSYLTNVIGTGFVPGFRPPFSMGGPVKGRVLTTSGALK